MEGLGKGTESRSEDICVLILVLILVPLGTNAEAAHDHLPFLGLVHDTRLTLMSLKCQLPTVPWGLSSRCRSHCQILHWGPGCPEPQDSTLHLPERQDSAHAHSAQRQVSLPHSLETGSVCVGGVTHIYLGANGPLASMEVYFWKLRNLKFEI